MRQKELKTLRNLCRLVSRLDEQGKEEFLAQAAALNNPSKEAEQMTPNGFSPESPAK